MENINQKLIKIQNTIQINTRQPATKRSFPTPASSTHDVRMQLHQLQTTADKRADPYIVLATRVALESMGISPTTLPVAIDTSSLPPKIDPILLTSTLASILQKPSTFQPSEAQLELLTHTLETIFASPILTPPPPLFPTIRRLIHTLPDTTKLQLAYFAAEQGRTTTARLLLRMIQREVSASLIQPFEEAHDLRQQEQELAENDQGLEAELVHKDALLKEQEGLQSLSNYLRNNNAK